MKRFGILIPTLRDRADLLDRVCEEIGRQVREANVLNEVITIVNAGDGTTGAKRNDLLAMAAHQGCYGVAFVDDDDLVGPTYVRRVLEFMESGCDCASLVGSIYFDGKIGKPFLHSIKYNEWSEDHQYYYRMPNHLNFMKLEAIREIHFPDQTFGEDGKFSYACRDAGVFKTEFEIPEVIYHYFCGFPKHAL